MRPSLHLLLGLIVSGILYYFNVGIFFILLFFFSSFLIIDLDHVPRFILKEKSLSPLKFYKWSEKKHKLWNSLPTKEKNKYKKPLFFLHNLEVLFLILLLSFFWPILFFLFLGFLFHLFCDFSYNLLFDEEKHHKISLIYTITKNKNKKEFLE